jgi:hypothetical protein
MKCKDIREMDKDKEKRIDKDTRRVLFFLAAANVTICLPQSCASGITMSAIWTNDRSRISNLSFETRSPEVTFEEAEEYAYDFAKYKNFVFRSNKNKELKAVELVCDRSQTPVVNRTDISR